MFFFYLKWFLIALKLLLHNINYFLTGCVFKSGILHEMLHRLGFEHEHIRPDRDKFLKVNWKNIKATTVHNFFRIPFNGSDINECQINTAATVGIDYGNCTKTDPATYYGLEYDWKSVMHYPFNTFGIDADQPTIIPLNESIKDTFIPYNDNSVKYLSDIDKQKLKFSYGMY